MLGSRQCRVFKLSASVGDVMGSSWSHGEVNSSTEENEKIGLDNRFQGPLVWQSSKIEVYQQCFNQGHDKPSKWLLSEVQRISTTNLAKKWIVTSQECEGADSMVNGTY